jgi:hypothetical protein
MDNKKKKKKQSRKIMYQQNFIQSNLKKYVGTKRGVYLHPFWEIFYKI